MSIRSGPIRTVNIPGPIIKPPRSSVVQRQLLELGLHINKTLSCVHSGRTSHWFNLLPCMPFISTFSYLKFASLFHCLGLLISCCAAIILHFLNSFLGWVVLIQFTLCCLSWILDQIHNNYWHIIIHFDPINWFLLK